MTSLTKDELLKEADAQQASVDDFARGGFSIRAAYHQGRLNQLRDIASLSDLAKYESQTEDLTTATIGICERNKVIRELRGVIEMILAAAESEMGTVDEAREALEKTKKYAVEE